MAEFLPSFPQFDPNPASGDVDPRWRKWMARFQNLMIAKDVSEDERQKAMLLHYVGEEMLDIYETLGVALVEGEENKVNKAIDALTSYFAPKMNTEYEVYRFRQARQEAEENFNHFLTRLRQLASTCGFADKDREIKTQIIQGCTSNKLRRKALSEPSITFQKLIEMAKAQEVADVQAAAMEASAASCQPTHHIKKIQKENRTYKGASSDTKLLCYNCGQSWPHRNRESCPAFGKTCRGCEKVGHFESVCRNKSNTSRAPYQPSTVSRRRTQNPRSNVNLLHVENCSDSSTDEYVYSINGQNITKQPKFFVAVCGRNILFTADSGASVNVMDERDYNRLEQKPNLIPTNVKIFPYGSPVPIPVQGTFTDTVRNGSYSTTATFFVVTGSCGSLLGWNTSTK